MFCCILNILNFIVTYLTFNHGEVSKCWFCYVLLCMLCLLHLQCSVSTVNNKRKFSSWQQVLCYKYQYQYNKTAFSACYRPYPAYLSCIAKTIFLHLSVQLINFFHLMPTFISSDLCSKSTLFAALFCDHGFSTSGLSFSNALMV